MNYNKIASDIIENVGGKQNILDVMHCATRLRLRLKDSTLVNEEALTDIKEVKGVFLAGDQYQVILGSGLVNLVCEEAKKILGVLENTVVESNEPKGSLLQRAIKLLSDIFVPIIPAIVAGGLLMGINNILTAPGLFVSGKTLIELYPQFADLSSMINMFANAAFTFLPVLIGFSATKKFGGNPYLGAAMGMVMVHPDLLNAYALGTGVEIPTWNVFGLVIDAVGYQGTVLPVLAVSFILANIEKRLHRITPTWLDNLSTPLISVLVTGFLTFIVVGPVLRIAGDGLAEGITWLYNSLGFVGGAIFGLLYAPIALTGMHHSFIAIETQLLAAKSVTGGSFIFPTAAMNNMAQGAAVFAVLLLTKNEKTKSICSASGVAAFLGITEPAMFGVTLKLKYPFYAAMIGSAVGGAYIAGTKTLAIGLGAAGLPGFISIAAGSWLNFGIGMILAVVTSFVLTLILFKRYCEKEDTIKPQESSITTIKSPMQGEVKGIEETPDPVFAGKMMGEGVVIFPTNGKVVSPIDGVVSFVFPTKHAIGLKANDGTEVLIHVGLDTVKLEGKPFTTFVEEGQTIKVGDPLLEANLEMIQEAGCSIATPVVITNQKEFTIVQIGSVITGQELLVIK